MRITGLATGLDMDQIIKDSMKPYRVKIDQQGQKKEIIEIKQKLYREVIKDSRDFYNKYLDVTSKDSLLLSGSYSTVTFSSSSENVTAKGGADVKGGSYTITGNLATPATAIVDKDIVNGKEIVVNGTKFTMRGESEREIAKNLNEDLKKSGINVTVKYSDFAGTDTGNKSALVFEAIGGGAENTFTIGGNITTVGTEVKGIDATAATLSGFTLDELKNAGGKLTIADKEITVDIKPEDKPEDIQKKLNEALASEKLTAEVKDNGEIIFTSTEKGSSVKEIKLSIGKNTGNFVIGKDSTATTNTMAKGSIYNKKISINGLAIDMTKATAGKEIEYLNSKLAAKNIEAKLDERGNVVLTSKILGTASSIEVKSIDSSTGVAVTEGKDASIVIKDSKGGVYTHKGSSNTVVLDGITFSFTGEIPAGGVTVNGKKDVTALKDKIVNFINDYNKLMEKLNTVTMERANKEFMPLTAEQKKEMSEDEIKLWNEKVKKGQLSRDSDITRIINSMKNAVTTPVKGNMLNFEQVGIKPVGDYGGTKNGTFTIDEQKLTKALEENSEEVMNLFISKSSNTEGMTDSDKYNSTGILNRMKDVLYNETVTVLSALVKKAGVESSATFSNNVLTKSINSYELKIKDMEKDFKRREQDLYSKYAKLETMMNKYNSQQSYLTQQLGGM